MGSLGRKRLWLLDMDGTLYLGDSLFPGTIRFLRTIRESGGTTISFVWNSPNPDVLNASQFVIIEKDSAIDFKLSVLPIDKNKIVEKSILILWEDMASHGGQSNFTREVLLRFFNETSLDTSDRFEVAVFDRKRNDTPLLTPLVGQFTGDVSRLTDAIEAHRNNGYQYASFSQSSDLYLAINDGLDLLKKEPVERVGVIVVVTAGLNLSHDRLCREHRR